jgi:hypothetical protein
MTRIESDNNKEFEVKELQGELNKIKKGLKRKQNRRILSCGSCVVVFVIILLILGGFGAYFLAKSNLMQIPYLSSIVYKEPIPAYIVETNTVNTAELDLLSVLKDRLFQSYTNINSAINSKITLQLSDKQLTQLIYDQVQQNSSLKNRIDYLQVAILPQNLEVFIKLKKPQNVILILDIVPRVDNSTIKFDVTSFMIGNLPMPNFIGKAFISPISEKIINLSITPFLSFGKISEIKLDYGKVLINVTITNIKGLF